MADRRYKKGVFIGNPAPKSQMDSPLNHGWQRYKISEATGAQLFRLGNATMRRVLPRDELQTGWVVKIEDQLLPIHYTGNLREITADVRDDRTELESKIEQQKGFRKSRTID